MNDEMLYRIEDVVYAHFDEWGDNPSHPGTLKLRMDSYYVTKRTPCGVWISYANYKSGSSKRFVNQKATKQFALPTPEEALLSFQERKKAQARILSAQLSRAKTALEIAQHATPSDVANHNTVSLWDVRSANIFKSI